MELRPGRNSVAGLRLGLGKGLCERRGAVELMDNLYKISAGGIIITVLHRVVNGAIVGVARNIVIRGLGCLGLAFAGFRSYRSPRVRVPFRVSVINLVLGGVGGNTNVGVGRHDCVGVV